MSAENRLLAVFRRGEDVVRIADIASMDMSAACADPAFPNPRSIAGGRPRRQLPAGTVRSYFESRRLDRWLAMLRNTCFSASDMGA